MWRYGVKENPSVSIESFTRLKSMLLADLRYAVRTLRRKLVSRFHQPPGRPPAPNVRVARIPDRRSARALPSKENPCDGAGRRRSGRRLPRLEPWAHAVFQRLCAP